jgi:DNA-directed RNA polymerase subunit RPC12/RpoP
MLKKIKERPNIACPACGSKMKIILTMTLKPPGKQQVCFT